MLGLTLVPFMRISTVAVNGFGLIVQGYIMNWKLNDQNILSDLMTLDSIITDLCPPINGWLRKYERRFKPN